MMKSRQLGIFAVAGLFVVLGGCGPSPEQLAREQARKKMEVAAKEMEAASKRAEAAANKGDVGAAMNEAMKVFGSLGAAATGVAGAAGAGSYEPIDFRRLKELLPQELAGFEKSGNSGERTNMFGVSVSQVKQSFKSADGKQNIDLEITDPGSLAGPFAIANAWFNLDIDKETDRGYEKTSTVAGRKLHEKWSKSNKQGTATLIVGNRFLVEIDGRGLEMNDLKALLAKIDLAKLDAMKGEGRKS
jgi:hypothetical protein